MSRVSSSRSDRSSVNSRKLRKPVKSDEEILGGEREAVLAKLEKTKAEIPDLKNRIDALKTKVEEKRNAMGRYTGLFTANEVDADLREVKQLGRRNAAQQTKVIMEKKLNHLQFEIESTDVKFQNALGRNLNMKKEIDILRRERITFDNLFDKLERELQRTKKEISATETEVEENYAARDAAQYEMQDVTTEMDHAEAEVRKEMAAINKLFMAEEAAAEGSAEAKVGNLSLEQENQLRRNVKKGMWKLGKDKALLRSLKMQLMKYEHTWNEIMKHTRCNTIEELTDKFREFERAVRVTFLSSGQLCVSYLRHHQKFGKVSAAGALVHEIETLEREVKELKALEEVNQREQEEAGAGVELNARDSIEDGAVRDLEAKLQGYQHKIHRLKHEQEVLLEPVYNLFCKLGLDRQVTASGEDPKERPAARVQSMPRASDAESSHHKPEEADALPPMFSHARVVQDVTNGITLKTLPVFLGILEQYALERVAPASEGGEGADKAAEPLR
ncbi:ODA1, partial [Symbiodinium sp. KB8]